MPVKGNILFCPNCNQPQSQINLINCVNCGNDLGAPNVNMVNTEEEINALEQRYNDANNYVATNGTKDIVRKFELFFNDNVKAVKNLTLNILHAWLVHTGAYQTYHRSVDRGQRLIAKPHDDQKRAVIDAYLYGTYGRDINFAALTLNDKGLFSYGDCTIIFNDDSIKFRASVLEENSYKFVETHKINLEQLNIPPGFRSTWQNKLKLTVSKLHQSFKLDINEIDFCEMVLFSEEDRNKDEFIEVHIYKELTNFALKTVIIPIPKNKIDTLFVKAIESIIPGKVNKI